MKNPLSGRGQRGFTLIEMLVVLAVMAILMLFAAPAIQTSIHQAKMRGIAQEVTVLMRQARMDAIKTSAQAVVRLVPKSADTPFLQVQAFSDRDSDGKLGANEPVLGTFPLPTGVTFLAPSNLTDKNSVEGFSPNADDTSGANVALFQRDGSIAAVGAFRFGDQSGNFLEVRVEPAATARIELRKWQNSQWLASGDSGKAWTWE
ncbi:MAG TPA: GspH/FimT family pseudopilin [Thermoanaerobaculia bacterium]|jgi:prepilin-type N-terminal cleavage/methylation domain-containing protein